MLYTPLVKWMCQIWENITSVYFDWVWLRITELVHDVLLLLMYVLLV